MPASDIFIESPLEKALADISSFANSMNEGKREFESRHKLVLWQSRIRGRFLSPLVQPHRSVSFIPAIFEEFAVAFSWMDLYYSLE
jgi:hypothetical protein